MKNITPIFLIIVSIIGLNYFVKPLYEVVPGHRAAISDYEVALEKVNGLKELLTGLTAKYNSISGEDLLRLEKVVPKDPDNTHLIADINAIAGKHGRVLKSARISESDPSRQSTTGQELPYKSSIIELSFSGSYTDLLAFLSDLENSLRLMDIHSISFGAPLNKGIYDYKVAFKIYSTP